MSQALDNWDFAGDDCAKECAAAGHLLRDTTGGARGDIVQAIITILRQIANGLPRSQPNPFDEDASGGKRRNMHQFGLSAA